MSSDVRVRFAPSPTGYLHVGGARTALFNYLFARQKQGAFVLRVEDTDLERSTDESLRMQISDLQWLGLDWDEGVNPEDLSDKGSLGPYRQSQRLSIYQEQAARLVEKGMAYYCFMTDEEIEAQKAEATVGAHLKSPYRDASLEDANRRFKSGEKGVIRFKNNFGDEEFVLNDMIRGEVRFPANVVGDFVLMRSNGMPVYNFCCAVDDAMMKISHVFRAEEHLPNTLRQMMIYRALEFDLPRFGHFSLILGEDKQKLSKRHGATSVHEYQENGYLPEAVNNYLALLGWSPTDDQEIFAIDELIQKFDLERITPSPAVFDETKLTWVNGNHIRSLSNTELWNRLEPLFAKHNISLPQDSSWQDKAIEIFKPRMERLTEGVELFAPLSQTGFAVSPEADEALGWERSGALVSAYIEELSRLDDDYLDNDQFGEVQNRIKACVGVKGKELFMPLRVCVIGKAHGADLKLLIPLLRREELLARAEVVKKKISS